MAYGIVKQTGGFIFVDSVVARETVFTIYLPCYQTSEVNEAQKVLSHSKETENEEGEGVVLLVEDEAPVRAFASRALRLGGYTVIEADSAEVALKTLEDPSLDVDVFVTDVVMPGLDGPSWVRQALRDRPDVKVVFVSGYAEEAFEEGQKKIPNSIFLPKPFSLKDLTQTVRKQIH
ncbi:response regulator [Pseudohalocynthiibacter sp. F2068]|jgi:two-component system, cell cycle sensor histidine kinase and response regulator CckA|uniref:response regulator n=1 Tax=Pseudohalocynthiibacter sp. F2068 TaxID=2926418 RepID=UPI001FF3297C|nr:response regulator [Pseudohalocynthiibacter sp. F2068]MCK0101087.1 response regulator [Pseudohalocynthiibacter sp. F2068]